MSSINNVVLTGRCGADPEVKVLDNGVKVANINLAVSKTYKTKDGEKKESTDWLRIVLYRGGAEIAEKFVHKGNQIAIQGSIHSRSWDKTDGTKGCAVEIFADQIQLLGGKPSGDAGEVKAQQQYDKAQEAAGTEATDDLPF